MNMISILEHKKAGLPLTDEEIAWFVAGFTRGDIPDYQASALAMAICLRGMDDRETATLTDCMMRSGDTVDLSALGQYTADKHSTGGVGDKTTLIVAPVVASLGGVMAKMSGRGLGHTGGTVDKLEALPGYRTDLTPAEFIEQARRVGIAVTGQTGNLTPADKKLYALRDVTATVDSIPLIASSVMSKKLAAGAHTIVLDVKVGRGAFMKSEADANRLAQCMVAIGKACGRRVSALITDMNEPLGYCVGNALELIEAAQVLRGEVGGRLWELCRLLCAEIVSLLFGQSAESALEQVDRVRNDGIAYRKLLEWLTAQGGDVSYITAPENLPLSPCTLRLLAPAGGYFAYPDAEAFGRASLLLGAGRTQKDAPIDHGAGIRLHCASGDRVEAGAPVATLYAATDARLQDAAALLRNAYRILPAPPPPADLCLGILRA